MAAAEKTPNQDHPCGGVLHHRCGVRWQVLRQKVINGESCFTATDPIRPRYRHPFDAKDCWQFAAIRLVDDQ